MTENIVRRLGRDFISGCGFVGGESGGTCPKCGGALMDERSIQMADTVQAAWEKAGSKGAEKIDALCATCGSPLSCPRCTGAKGGKAAGPTKARPRKVAQKAARARWAKVAQKPKKTDGYASSDGAQTIG